MRDFPTYLDWTSYTHYSCQSVPVSKLSKNNIQMIGNLFGIEDREVLKVPIKTLNKYWYNPKSWLDAQAQIESLLRKL